jgi:hypothetical protein
MNTLLEKHSFEDVIKRINQLTNYSTANWGEMNVAQMLKHCAEVQEVMNGKELKNTPWLIRFFGKWIAKFVLSKKPYPKGMSTHPQYKVADVTDFEVAKQRILSALEYFHTQKPNHTHPIFGRLSLEDMDWASFKHIDHHLKQFGV